MKNQPRNHHYVPRFYLERFAMSGADDRLFVLDKRQRKKWSSTPRKTARANDFYTVELDNLDPMGIEKALADVEGMCAVVIREIISQKRLPTGDSFGVLLNFVALSTVRVPSIRSTHSHFIDQVVKKLSHLAFLGPEGAKRLRDMSKLEGKSLPDDEIQKLQTFVESNDYDIKLEQNWHIQTMIESVNVLLPLLANRHWAIWAAADGTPDLVTSDRPVALWASPPLPGPLSPNFTTPNTLLTIPLSRRVLLASQLEEMPSLSYVMDRQDVALMNTLRAMFSNQVYSAQEDWVWTDNGEILNSQAFLDSLSTANA